MATSEIVGSWFPTGYYGHFRSKSRNDFVCEYRQLARPQPPKKFLNRSTQPTRKHVFSHHDNRQAFLNDALIFQQGLGRRRVPNSTYQFKQDFMTWMPEREYVERIRPLVSTYRVDFHDKQKTCTVPVAQIFTKRPKTSFDGVPTSTYRYAHGEEAPNKSVINAMNNDALKLSLLNRKNRAMSAKPDYRETVASCMVWQSARGTTDPAIRPKSEPARPCLPAATQTSTFIPHPPPPIQEEMLTEVSQVSAPQLQQEMEQLLPGPTQQPPPAVTFDPTRQLVECQ